MEGPRQRRGALALGRAIYGGEGRLGATRQRRRQRLQGTLAGRSGKRVFCVTEEHVAGVARIGQGGVVEVVHEPREEGFSGIGAGGRGQQRGHHGDGGAVVGVALGRGEHEALLARAGDAGARLVEQRASGGRGVAFTLIVF
ncbi:MAG: hypothetical protein BRD48_05460 [Bacteroidetes bacterium QS_9_68_14]|nr:MAG: hypothetical protein BRD48_05460 [Bacteroidetes bacterium QS_9_68_14]